MSDVISKIGDGLWNAFLMAWEVWWALVLGFAISAIVQAWVPRERIQAALAGDGLSPIARATGLGAVASERVQPPMAGYDGGIDGPAAGFDASPHDGQAQADSASLTRAGIVHSKEWLKDLAQ